MNHLLNLLATHHSRTLRNPQKEHPDQVNLLVSKHNPGKTVTAQKQATGACQKNAEQNAHYLLTIRIRRAAFALLPSTGLMGRFVRRVGATLAVALGRSGAARPAFKKK